VPVIDGVGMMGVPLWAQEPWLNGPLQTLLDTNTGAFVDVGVNLGQTLLKVKTLHPARRYFGFEPNPLCVAYAKRLVAANAFSDCVVAPFGLSDAARALPLFSRADDPTDSSSTVVSGLYSTQESWTTSPVSVIRGDDALCALNVGRVGVVKIDVEGAELEVLQGLRGTLESHRPAVICELLPSYAAGGKRWAFRQPRTEAVVALMRELGYQLFRLLPSGGATALERIDAHGDPALTNYAFVPPDAARWFRGDARTYVTVNGVIGETAQSAG